MLSRRSFHREHRVLRHLVDRTVAGHADRTVIIGACASATVVAVARAIVLDRAHTLAIADAHTHRIAQIDVEGFTAFEHTWVVIEDVDGDGFAGFTHRKVQRATRIRVIAPCLSCVGRQGVLNRRGLAGAPRQRDREGQCARRLVDRHVIDTETRTVIVGGAGVAAETVIHLALAIVEDGGGITVGGAITQGAVGSSAICVQQGCWHEGSRQGKVFSSLINSVRLSGNAHIKSLHTCWQVVACAIEHVDTGTNVGRQAGDHLHGGRAQVAVDKGRAIAEL